MPKSVFDVILDIFREIRALSPDRIQITSLVRDIAVGRLSDYVLGEDADSDTQFEIVGYRERSQSVYTPDPDRDINVLEQGAISHTDIFERDDNGNLVTDEDGDYITTLVPTPRFLPNNFEYKEYDDDWKIVKKPPFKINGNGELIYCPSGQFNRNQISVDVRIFDANYGQFLLRGPAPGRTSPDLDLSGPYANDNNMNMLNNLIIADSEEGAIIEIAAEVTDDGSIFIGSPLEDADFWQFQGMTLACMFTSSASAINSYNSGEKGILGYVRDGDGRIIGVIPRTWTDADGNSHYFPTRVTHPDNDNILLPEMDPNNPDGLHNGSPIPLRNVGLVKSLGFADLVELSATEIRWGPVSLWSGLFGNSLSPSEVAVSRQIDPNFNPVSGNPQLPAGITYGQIMKHFGLPYRTGRAYSLDMIINELEAGNKLLVAVDNEEIVENLHAIRTAESRGELIPDLSTFDNDVERYAQHIKDETGQPVQERVPGESEANYLAYLNRVASAHNERVNILGDDEYISNLIRESTGGAVNHAIWLTGIEISDGEVYVHFNDSARTTGGLRLPLTPFLDVWDDSGFLFTSIGDSIPENVRLEKAYAVADSMFGGNTEILKYLDVGIEERKAKIREKYGIEIADKWEQVERNALAEMLHRLE